MTATSATDATVDELGGSFGGELVQPGDPTYDQHRRVWNGSIDRSPALIARCRGVADVIASIRFARHTGLPVAVRGGGHSYPGHSVCDGGIVIDLGPMRDIRVDPQARTARVQAGVLWAELDRETQAFGLATRGGFVSHTGVAGLTLGGGIGWLHRKHGLTIDQLVSVDLVTAVPIARSISHCGVHATRRRPRLSLRASSQSRVTAGCMREALNSSGTRTPPPARRRASR